MRPFTISRGSTERFRFGRWNNRLDVRPLIVRQIARIAQLVTIVFQAVFGRPHWRPPSNQAAANESQMIHPIQLLPGRTLTALVAKPKSARKSSILGQCDNAL